MILNLARKTSGLPGKKALADASWVDIAKVSQAGKAAQHWQVGDKKELSLGSERVWAVIVGFAHDDLADGSGKAGITFGLENCLSAKRPMNSGGDNECGWSSAPLRAELRTQLWAQLPEELRAAIKPVLKRAADGIEQVETVEDTLFLFSEIEALGEVEQSWEAEGSLYPYFAVPSRRVKTSGGTACHWWLRSAADYSATCYCIIEAGGGGASIEADTQQGVSFGFCI